MGSITVMNLTEIWHFLSYVDSRTGPLIEPTTLQDPSG